MSPNNVNYPENIWCGWPKPTFSGLVAPVPPDSWCRLSLSDSARANFLPLSILPQAGPIYSTGPYDLEGWTGVGVRDCYRIETDRLLVR